MHREQSSKFLVGVVILVLIQNNAFAILKTHYKYCHAPVSEKVSPRCAIVKSNAWNIMTLSDPQPCNIKTAPSENGKNHA